MRKIILIGVAIEFVVLVIVGGLLWLHSQESKQTATGYATREEAILQGMLQATDEAITQEEADRRILATIEEGGKIFYIIVVPYMEQDVIKHYAFVGFVEEAEGRFRFYKATADVGLDPEITGDARPPEGFSCCFDNVAGRYVAVGKVLKEGYVPGADGEWVNVNEDGLFAVVREDAPPDIEFVKATD